MASFATAARVSARIVARRTAQDGAAAVTSRAFRTSAAAQAAQNFTMPALSPTMTQGNIASWKVKEGDSYSAGDVLLEIETDKATMDVEAQDDGVLVKIFQGDGSQSVQVGSRIGVVAESGDDIASIEIPADEQPAAAQSSSKEQEPAQKTQGSQSSDADAAPSQPRGSAHKQPAQKYPLYPSVAHLVKENKLDDEAVSRIVATGPQGRLLKGDVLAYLGSISSKRPQQIKDLFDHNSHLDLSNIKVAPKTAAPEPKKADRAAEPPTAQVVTISLPISLSAAWEVQKKLQATLGSSLPLSTLVARATEVANEGLPRSKNYKPTADELFNQVLGLDKVGGSRGNYVPQVDALPSFTGVAPKPKAARPDLIDILAGGSTRSQPRARPVSANSGRPGFSITVAKGEEKRAQVFLERLKSILENEPGRLVL
jgi:biotin carboxyl carrier protein